MKTLASYLMKYKKIALLGPLFKLLEAMFELIVPLVVSFIIDKGIVESDRSVIMKGFIALILLGIIGYTCSVTAQYFAAKSAVGTACDIRLALFDKVNRLSFSNIDKIGVPSLITRLTGDTNSVQNGINMFLRLLLRSPFVVFGALIMAMTISLKMSLVFLAVIIILFAIVITITAKSLPANKSVQEKLDNVTLHTRENLTGTRVIRAFGMEDTELYKFGTSTGELERSQKHAGFISSLLNPMTGIVLNIGIILLFYFSGFEVKAGNLTSGNVVALYNYMTQILIELVKLTNLIVTISKSITCMKRVEAVLLLEDGMTFPKEMYGVTESENSVEFRNVSLSYLNGENSLEGISFTAKKGQTIGIIGGTGSGKTSIANLIERFYDATEGSVIINGTEISEYPYAELRGKIGYVLQKASMFKGSIGDNLRFASENADEGVMWDAIRIAQAVDVVNSKENGLASEIEQSGRNLSGGQRQRLSIARALVRRPEILILDDSTSALDFATEAALKKAILELDYKPTVFIISQRASSVMACDNIIVLDDGRMVGEGDHSGLMENCEVYREIYYSQFGEESAE